MTNYQPIQYTFVLIIFSFFLSKIEKKADPAKNYQAFEDDESTVSGFSRM